MHKMPVINAFADLPSKARGIYCADLPELSLLDNAISTKMECWPICCSTRIELKCGLAYLKA